MRVWWERFQKPSYALSFCDGQKRYRLALSSLFETDRGPLVVSTARPHKGSHLVAFVGFGDRTSAEALRGVVLRAEPLHDPDEMWVHELIGAAVVDQEGVDRGHVVDVVANPASDLLELTDGNLVPVRFVTAFDSTVGLKSRWWNLCNVRASAGADSKANAAASGGEKPRSRQRTANPSTGTGRPWTGST